MKITGYNTGLWRGVVYVYIYEVFGGRWLWSPGRSELLQHKVASTWVIWYGNEVKELMKFGSFQKKKRKKSNWLSKLQLFQVVSSWRCNQNILSFSQISPLRSSERVHSPSSLRQLAPQRKKWMHSNKSERRPFPGEERNNRSFSWIR